MYNLCTMFMYMSELTCLNLLTHINFVKLFGKTYLKIVYENNL